MIRNWFVEFSDTTQSLNLYIRAKFRISTQCFSALLQPEKHSPHLIKMQPP